jgi:hypothetical protein
MSGSGGATGVRRADFLASIWRNGPTLVLRGLGGDPNRGLGRFGRRRLGRDSLCPGCFVALKLGQWVGVGTDMTPSHAHQAGRLDPCVVWIQGFVVSQRIELVSRLRGQVNSLAGISVAD